MSVVYATTTDLTDGGWAPQAPAAAPTLLRFASRLVRRATMTATYATDDAGAPTHEVVRAAFRDATCAQVAAWIASGVDPVAGGAQPIAAPVRGKSLGSGRIEYDTSGSASVTALTARARAATSLGQEALLILADAGLIGPRPGATR
jgi:hypothetical protein